MIKTNIAGLSLSGGRRDNFYFCLLEYYEESERWFLKSLLQVKDQDELGGDDAIRAWAKDFEIKDLVVDFPLSNPPCHECKLDCPGISKCEVEQVSYIRGRMHALLDADKSSHQANPKNYERVRLESETLQGVKETLKNKSNIPMLTKSFKRRIRKGFIPYWNRSIDLWIWENYYNQLLKLFNVSYDSFGNASLMLLSRFAYIQRHLPREMNLFETFIPLTLLELLKEGVIGQNLISNLKDIDLNMEARQTIVKLIEEKFGIFIYDNDLRTLCRQPKAFDSFLLALTGQRIVCNKLQEIPEWCFQDNNHFVIPDFSTL